MGWLARGGAAAARVGGFLERNKDAVALAGTIYAELKRQAPRLDDEVVVEVTGQPGSTKRQLYFLALSVACSLVKRYDGLTQIISPPPGRLAVEYDAADNWVRVTLQYNTSLLTAAIASSAVLNSAALVAAVGVGAAAQVANYLQTTPRALPLYGQLVLFGGPRDEVLGRPFNFTGGVLSPGIPTSATSAGAPALPWVGRTVLTTSPTCVEPVPGPAPPVPNFIDTPNPKPPGDNRSRGAFVEQSDPLRARTAGDAGLVTETGIVARLCRLVYAALADPGGQSQEAFVNPTPGPRGG